MDVLAELEELAKRDFRISISMGLGFGYMVRLEHYPRASCEYGKTLEEAYKAARDDLEVQLHA